MRTTTIRNDGANRAGGIVKAIRDERVASLRGLLGFGLALCAGALANSAWAVSVSLTAPSNSVIAAPATITLTATATPGAGRRILRVDFFQGTSRIGTDTSAPYGVTWSNVPRGNYILTATAIDSGGSVAVSNQVFVRVDTPPTVSLTSPVNNGVFAPGANIPLTANAADADEIVTKVEFFSGGTLLGTQFLAPYSIIWNNVPAGRYSLTARATDLVGLVTTSAPVTITVDAPPTVSITSPANNALFVAPATVTVSATAADADGSVTQVEFFDGAMPVGTVPAPGGSTYSVTLNLAAGTHTLTARATDNLGATATSAAVTLNVDAPPAVSIGAPANGAIFTAPASVTITATTTDPDGSVTQVEFFDGATPVGTVPTTPGASTYSVTLANVSAGTHTLIARATDNQGATTTSAAVTITVNSNVAQIYYIHPDPLNTPRLIADSTGTTVWRWDQSEPFGNDVPNNNPSGAGAFDFPLRFPGQYFDRETNVAYNINRDYDPSIGRYVESDPIGLRGGKNTYAYVGDNPLSYVDPLGLAKFCCRPLDSSFFGGFLKFRHCFVVADDGTNYALFPVLKGGGLLGQPSPDSGKDDPLSPQSSCSDCPSDCGVDQNQCLRDANSNYPLGGYSWVGTNSNTFAGTLARKCCKGGVPPGVRKAPGVGLNPPDPFPMW